MIPGGPKGAPRWISVQGLRHCLEHRGLVRRDRPRQGTHGRDSDVAVRAHHSVIDAVARAI